MDLFLSIVHLPLSCLYWFLFLAVLWQKEDESVQVVSTNGDKNMQGFESWAVEKIMATEAPNREAMYRVFQSLWFTKEEIDFVALKEGS
ncbi:hypothetical protein PVK06_027187 [Gossypium arboreum]|uniref:Uncharacterized protein n=1 Tax=Gossypium arboreum TaxID=29729 RepID=A0ABR0P0X7_GOSAR|nr:hypothetical protein PVK06_027187 [Gossypium arboreum]